MHVGRAPHISKSNSAKESAIFRAEKSLDPAGEGPPSSQASKVPVLAINDVQARFAQHLESQRPRLEKQQSALPHIRHISKKVLPRAIEQLKQGMGQDEMRTVAAITARADGLVASPGMPDLSYDREALSPDIEHLLQCMQAAAAAHPGDGPDAQQQRRCALIDCLGAVFRNEFHSDAARWAANVANVTVRTGMIVALCTFMRDAIAFELSKAAPADGQEMWRVAGIFAIAIAPTYNILGGILSGALGTANLTSIVSRVWLGALNLSVLLACYAMGTLDELGAILPSFIFYTIARDTCNFFFPLRDNLTSLPKRAVFASAGIYGLFQWLGGMVMGKAVPEAGAGAAALFNAVDSFGHGLMNALLEICDDLTLPAIVKYMENREYRQKEAHDIRTEDLHAEYMKELSAFAKDLLKTPAEERQQKIDQKNLELYEREFERMKHLDGTKLDDAHIEYLDHLRKEFPTYQRKKLEHLWRSSGTPNNLSDAQLSELGYLERELDVYKKTRELDRMKVLHAENRLGPEQEKYLTWLASAVEYELHEWLKLTAENQEGLSDETKERLRHLDFEFGSSTGLESAVLRPIASLQSNVQNSPDFTCLDKMIKNACRLRDILTKDERNQLKQELSNLDDELNIFAEDLLNTPAGERRKKIDAKNLELYRQEIQRIELLDRNEISVAHEEYLHNLKKEFQTYLQAQAVERAWSALSVAPDCLSHTQLDQLRGYEINLGIYTKTRELKRMQKMENLLDEEQKQYLAILGQAVALDLDNYRKLTYEDWSELSGEAKNRLKRLEYELNSHAQLKPPALRPISDLQVDGTDAPDFTRFDRVAEAACRFRDAGALTKEEREQIVQELFVYEFVRTHLPLPRLTPLEDKVMASIFKENPHILPVEFMQTLGSQVAEKRSGAAEPLRIRLGFFPWIGTTWIEAWERIARQALITNAARQNAFATAVGAVGALMSLLPQGSDDNTQLAVGSLIAAFAISLVYPGLILGHTEGASPGRPIERPGAWGLGALRNEPQVPEEVTTPRGNQGHQASDDRNLSEASGGGKLSQLDEFPLSEIRVDLDSPQVRTATL